MARVAWIFNGYSWAINPETDTGWRSEDIVYEGNPINSSRSVFQWGGRKSERRVITGWIWGPTGTTQYSNMMTWKENRVTATLTDHMGISRTARMIKFDAEPVRSVAEWQAGRQTYKYTAEFISLS